VIGIGPARGENIVNDETARVRSWPSRVCWAWGPKTAADGTPGSCPVRELSTQAPQPHTADGSPRRPPPPLTSGRLAHKNRALAAIRTGQLADEARSRRVELVIERLLDARELFRIDAVRQQPVWLVHV